ncbi:acyltransferase family protein [Lachnobacterium bovis]|uniref:acyltransferase family protein n=1 Tax=Lachnobacterium bovis TaxID=140626 RepID=UPI0003B4E526|nr:acyltransferase [Lachnobacterium bovis]
MEKRNVNVKLNLLKGFACMGVVFIHITFPGLFGQIVLYASAYAVPIFFMVAGYYAYGKDKDVIKRRLIKIVKIFAYAYMLFFLYKLTSSIKNHEVLQWLSSNYNWKTPIKNICFCTINFAIPLWYLIAMIETYIVWLYVVKQKKEHLVIKITPILFLLQIILTSYCETMQFEWFWKINFVTRAMPWFMLGYYLNSETTRSKRSLKTSTLIMMVIVGCAIAVIPSAFDLSVKFNVIGYIPYAFGLFSLALKNPSKSICKPVEFIGDKLSLNIYIFHALMDGVISFVFLRLLNVNTEANLYLWLRPIIVLVATIFASWVVYKIKLILAKKPRNI